MKKIISIFLLLISLSTIAQKQIATFTAEKYPVYLIGFVVQETPDKNFLLFRGGNFQNHELVQSLPGVPNLSNILLNQTDWAGLMQPPVEKLPSIPGYEVAYCYDVKANVTGYGLAKESTDYNAYKNDPNLRLFKSLKAAQKEVRTIPETMPINITVPVPPVIKNPEPELKATSPASLGRVGYRDGQSYFELLKQLPGGTAIFDFKGQAVNYPGIDKLPNGILERNGLVPIDLPTHSTTANWEGGTAGIVSQVSMKLFDSSGRLVWELYDTKGGFHTNFNGGPRGNNHPDESLRWIKPDLYTLHYENISENNRVIQRFEVTNDRNLQPDIYIPAKTSRTITLDLRSQLSQYHTWKLNCNFYTIAD